MLSDAGGPVEHLTAVGGLFLGPSEDGCAVRLCGPQVGEGVARPAGDAGAGHLIAQPAEVVDVVGQVDEALGEGVPVAQQTDALAGEGGETARATGSEADGGVFGAQGADIFGQLDAPGAGPGVGAYLTGEDAGFVDEGVDGAAERGERIGIDGGVSGARGLLLGSRGVATTLPAAQRRGQEACHGRGQPHRGWDGTRRNST